MTNDKDSAMLAELLGTMRERCTDPCRSEKAELGCDCDAARRAAVMLRQPTQSDALREAWQEYFEANDELAELERNRLDSTSRFERALYKKSDAEDKARRALAALQEQSKFKFTLNGEESVLAVDDGMTMRVGNVSPSMELTVGTLAPSLIVFMNQQNDEPVMTIHPDGKITLGEKADPTEAAAACIEAMSGMIQDMIKNAVLREQSK
jgi:hypothetical protein